MEGLFITFEGVDGAGKSSHIPWLAKCFEASGREVVCTREPGGTPVGERLRTMLVSEEMSAEAEILLLLAGRNEHVETVIKPALAQGKVVLCDRYSDSTYAFQGGGRGVPAERIRALEECCGTLRPDLTFFFDLPVEVARSRIVETRQLDRFEAEKNDFHERVRAAYWTRVNEDTSRFAILDATRAIHEIRADILERLVGRSIHVANQVF